MGELGMANDRRFPRGALVSAAVLVALSLGAAGFARLSGIGLSQAPEGTAVQSRVLRFADRADGAVVVYDVRSERVAAVLPPETNGFVRGVMRSLVRERRREDVGSEPPFLLTRWSDGRLSIEDVATRERIELTAFGQTNVAAFARFLDNRSASR
jgi:putative photosynthetic complex assembly protein